MPISWEQCTHHAPESVKSEVDDGIRLFAKPIYLRILLDSKVSREWARDVERDGLPDQRPKDDIVKNEHEIEIALLVPRILCARLRNAMRDEYERCKWVGRVLGDIWPQELPVRPQDDGDEEELERRRWGEIWNMLERTGAAG